MCSSDLDPEQRQSLLDAADRLQRATTTWRELAGDVPASWVLAHPERLTESAALVPGSDPTAPGDDGPAGATDEGEAVRAGLMSRVRAVRDIGRGERLPLVLDDPLAHLDAAEKSAVLGFMDRLAVEQQLIICTDDLRIVTWARLEAMTGNAALIDVNPGRAHSGAGSVAPS